MSESPTPGRTGRRLIAIAGLLLVIVAALAFRPLQVTYHRWQMERGLAYLYGEDAGIGAGELLWVDTYQGAYGDNTHLEHHMHRLVELGIVRRMVYQFQHIETGSGAKAGPHLFRRAHELPSLYYSSNWASEPRPMVLEVFNEWPDSAAWDEFVATHDVPDYREQFMSDESP